jgi:hypothetical protein
MKLPKKLPSLSDVKSPAAVVTGQRVKKMPPFPKWGAPVTGQKVHKLPSLSDEKSSPGSRGAGVSKG